MVSKIVEINTPGGQRVGSFVDPEVVVLSDHCYQLSGLFLDEHEKRVARMAFNPEALPYVADISAVSQCSHNKLVNVYVQRGLQPALVIGICAAREAGTFVQLDENLPRQGLQILF